MLADAMNDLLKWLEECMSLVEVGTGENVSAQFVFPEDFPGFQGHFPGRPTLPGVCLVQAALVLLKKWAGGAVTLRTLVTAKFLEPVGPRVVLTMAGRVELADDGTAVLKAKVTCGSKKIAELVLRAARVEAKT
jgi:3-hydroxyacyl-[acyl-carrier-protein] dehydratase